MFNLVDKKTSDPRFFGEIVSSNNRNRSKQNWKATLQKHCITLGVDINYLRLRTIFKQKIITTV